MNKKIFYFLIAAPLFALFLTSAQVYYLIYIWANQSTVLQFNIKPGEGFSSINARLYHQGIISNPRVFYHYSKFNNLLTKFKAGVFEITPGQNMPQVINSLIWGKSIQKSITIPEGKNIFEIAKLLEQEEIVTAYEFLKWAQNADFCKGLGIENTSVEGYLYPDTYQFSKNVSAQKVIEAMVDLFNKKTRDINFDGPMLSKSEVIILASIVEKETGAKHERPMIAGVFLNRLHKKMRLQSDPTIIYGKYPSYSGNIKKSDLLEYSPYNTYVIKALPVGPIANPGIDSIKAVLNPDRHNFLFFVSQNDGTHIFTERYSDHSKAVNKFQKTAKNRVGKSWRNLKK